jgi:tRNA pseudouridine55 synthase
MARDGEVVPLQPRPVEIHELTLVEQQGNERSVFEAECGKGTYVRALARDMGRLLGVTAIFAPSGARFAALSPKTT